MKTNFLFNFTNHEHVRRENTKSMQPNGRDYIPGFSTILKKVRWFHSSNLFTNIANSKGSAVNEEMEFRKTYIVRLTPEQLTQWTENRTSLECYRGEAESPPEWIDLEPSIYTVSF